MRRIIAPLALLCATHAALAEPGGTPGTPAAPAVPAVPASPSTPNRPGRNTPGPGNVPAIVPPPAGGTGDTDADLLRQTAADLDIAPPDRRPDQRLLNWFGARTALANRGLLFDFSITADESKNLRGGADTNNDVFRHLFDARFSYDTDAGLGWPGGTVSVDFQNQSGRNGSDSYGDAQGFDNADADGRTQVSELWYEQAFGNTFRVKLGKVDVSTEFAAPEFGTEFINSSFGYSPTITGLPTYPDPAVSLNVFYHPTAWLYVSYGVYDGGDGEPTGDHPPHTAYRGDSDFFQIAEAGVRWTLADRTLPGRLAVGVTYSSARFARFRGGEQNGTESIYVVAEQKLFHNSYYAKDDERGVYAFAQFGSADEEVNAFRQHAGGGLTWVGPYRATNLDSLGVGFTTAFFSDATGSPYLEDSETSVEAFYNFQATPYLSVKPDLQYVIHPGGDAELNDALVASLRVTVAL